MAEINPASQGREKCLIDTANRTWVGVGRWEVGEGGAQMGDVQGGK